MVARKGKHPNHNFFTQLNGIRDQRRQGRRVGEVHSSAKFQQSSTNDVCGKQTYFLNQSIDYCSLNMLHYRKRD